MYHLDTITKREAHCRIGVELPQLIREGVDKFKTEKEQLLFLYSTLTVCSGLLTNVKGEYDQKTVYPNLFLLVVAPPASGKSTMLFSEILVKKIHEKKVKDSRKAIEDYNRKIKAGGNVEGVQPPFNVVLIPANTSSSKILNHLADNEKSNTPSIIIESEIDTLVNALKQEWGNFSDTIRKVWHNEPVRSSRKGSNEYIELNSSKLALALSGTFNQVQKLIPNTEDGLYSRFLVYQLKGRSQWRDVSPCPDSVNLSDYFEQQAIEYLAFWEYISERTIEVLFTKEQWDRTNDVFHELHSAVEEPELVGLVFRHGLMLYKISMVLTTFRIFEEKSESDVVECRPEDFETAMYLVKRSLSDSMELFSLLPRGGKKPIDRRDVFFSKLPDEFETTKAIQILSAEQGAPKQRTIEQWLEMWVKEGSLIRPERGKYKKTADRGNTD